MSKKLALFFARFKITSSSVIVGSAVMVSLAVPSFAADPLPTLAITPEMLTPVVTGVVSNVGVILPVGLALFAIMIGIRIIPGLISSFVRMR